MSRDSNDGGAGNKLKRTSSSMLGKLIKSGEALIGDNLKRVDESDFHLVLDGNNKLGEGKQGSVHRLPVFFPNEAGQYELRECAAKILNSKQFQYAKKQLLLRRGSQIAEAHDDTADEQNHIPFASHTVITDGDETSTDHNIVHLIAVLEYQAEQFCAILPYCNLFLDKFLPTLEMVRAKNPGLHFGIILHILSNILEALHHLNFTKHYVHGDVNFSNIVFHNNRWCLVDLDCAVHVGSDVDMFQGTPYFMHPVCFVDKGYLSTPCNDLYALGLMLQIFLGKVSLNQQSELTGPKAQYACALEKERIYNQLLQTPFLLAGSKSTEFYNKLLAMPKFEALSQLADQMCGCHPSLVDETMMCGLIGFVNDVRAGVAAECAGGEQELNDLLERFYAEIIQSQEGECDASVRAFSDSGSSLVSLLSHGHSSFFSDSGRGRSSADGIAAGDRVAGFERGDCSSIFSDSNNAQAGSDLDVKK